MREHFISPINSVSRLMAKLLSDRTPFSSSIGMMLSLVLVCMVLVYVFAILPLRAIWHLLRQLR